LTFPALSDKKQHTRNQQDTCQQGPIIMSRFWSPIIHDLKPYVPGEQPKAVRLVKLNTNENPYGPSPKALKAIADGTGDNLRLYPDPNADSLRAAIAEFNGLTSEQIFVGNGSDEVLAHTFLGLLRHERPLLFPDITYSFYPVYCGLYQVQHELVPLTADFTIDPDDYLRPNGGIIFPNPNAPTGVGMSLAGGQQDPLRQQRFGGRRRRGLYRFRRRQRRFPD
jgi:histidinol-phosphate aminotransferase